MTHNAGMPTDYGRDRHPLTPQQSLVRQLWVRALRSGQYTQGHGALKTRAGGHCCLGVLCNLVDPEGWETRAELRPTAAVAPWAQWVDAEQAPAVATTVRMPEQPVHRGKKDYPAVEISELAGLSKMEMDWLAGRNDSACWSFSEIAYEIEKGFPEFYGCGTAGPVYVSEPF